METTKKGKNQTNKELKAETKGRKVRQRGLHAARPAEQPGHLGGYKNGSWTGHNPALQSWDVLEMVGEKHSCGTTQPIWRLWNH